MNNIENKAQAQRDWSLMGSSYIAGLIGDDNYSTITPIEIYQAMRGLKRKEISKELKEIFRWGHLLEEPIIKSFEEDNNIELIRNKTFYIPNTRDCATPDGVNFEKPLLLEVKSVRGDMGWRWAKGVPGAIIMQTIWQGYCFNENQKLNNKPEVDKIFVRALIDRTKEDFIVDYDVSLLEKIKAVANDFIKNYVNKGIAPPIDCTVAYSDYLLSQFPQVEFPKEHVFLDANQDVELDSLMNDYFLFYKDKKEIEKKVNELRNKLMAKIGGNYGAAHRLGKVIWYDTKPKISQKKVILDLANRLQLTAKELDKIKESHRPEIKDGEGYRVFKPYLKKM